MGFYTHIYLLVSKAHDKIYIGSTNNPKARLINHKSKGTMGNTFLNPDDVEMEIIDLVSEDVRFEWEAHYVELFKKWGFELINKKDVNQSNPFFIRKNTKKLSRQEYIWVSQLKQNGDAVLISNNTGIIYRDVAYAIKQGIMTNELYKIIIAFYKKRQKSNEKTLITIK